MARRQRIAVELDGYGNHHTRAQLKRDRRKELALRNAGLTPVRYAEEQLERRDEVIADLRRLGAPREGRTLGAPRNGPDARRPA